MTSQYHIIENPNRTFTIVYGRAVISTHNSREAAQRVIDRLVKRDLDDEPLPLVNAIRKSRAFSFT